MELKDVRGLSLPRVQAMATELGIGLITNGRYVTKLVLADKIMEKYALEPSKVGGLYRKHRYARPDVSFGGGAVPPPQPEVQIVTEKDEPDEALIARIRAEVMAEVAQLGTLETKISIIYPDGSEKEISQKMPKEFKTILELASQRVNVLMVGPAGCGKTFLGEKIAEALGLQFYAVSCSVGMSESTLAGWLLPTGKGGTFEYHASPFVTCYENGGVFLFDEIDSADPNTLTFINAALANGHMTVPQRLGNAVVRRHKDFVCLAAANTFGLGADMQYVGRNQLDAATLDRFRAGVVPMDYDPHVENSLCDVEVLAWGRELRKKIASHGLQRIMSMRTLIAFTKMKKAYGWGRDEWSARYFADWTADEKSRLGVGV